MSTPSSAPAPQPRRLQVFCCHSSVDKPYVRNLTSRLRADGFDPWLDEERIKPGMRWRWEIQNAVPTSDVFLVFLSRRAVSRMRFWPHEMGFAISIAKKMPPDTIFVVPAVIEKNVRIPKRLRQYHRVDLFEPGSYERLLSTLKQKAQSPRRQRDHPPAIGGKRRRRSPGHQRQANASPASTPPKAKLSFLKRWFQRNKQR